MNRRNSLLVLLLGICAAIAWPLMHRARPHHERTSAEKLPETGATDYMVTRRLERSSDPLVQSEGSIHFTFDGDPAISPGSLQKMTRYMREAEMEIATKLGREIKFSE